MTIYFHGWFLQANFKIFLDELVASEGLVADDKMVEDVTFSSLSNEVTVQVCLMTDIIVLNCKVREVVLKIFFYLHALVQLLGRSQHCLQIVPCIQGKSTGGKEKMLGGQQ